MSLEKGWRDKKMNLKSFDHVKFANRFLLHLIRLLPQPVGFVDLRRSFLKSETHDRTRDSSDTSSSSSGCNSMSKSSISKGKRASASAVQKAAVA
jgi:hypothetical protein